MDRYTMEALRGMLCRELDEAVMRGIKTHQDLDVVKDATEAIKNLNEIEMNLMGESPEMGMGMDMRKYSQQNSNYARRNYAMDNSYNYYDEGMFARGGNSRGNGGGGGQGGSSRAYSPYMMARGYSGTGSKEEVLQELHQIVEEASDEKVKGAVLECVSKMEKMM